MDKLLLQVLAGVELILFMVATMVLCFGFVLEIVVKTEGYF